MADLGNDLDGVPKHALKSFLTAIAIVALAVLFSWLEKLCEQWKLPNYVIFGTKAIAVGLFIIDGVLVLGTAAIFALRYLGIGLISTLNYLKDLRHKKDGTDAK